MASNNIEFDIHQDSFDPFADDSKISSYSKEELPVGEVDFDPFAEDDDPLIPEKDKEAEKPAEVKEEAKEEGEEKEGTEEESSEEYGDTFQKLTNSLVELEIFSLDEGEETLEIPTPEKFAERWVAEKQKGAQMIVQQYVGEKGPAYEDAWEKIFVQGLDPFEYFTAQQTIESYESLDLTSEENQKLVVRQALKRQGYPDERIEAKLTKAIDLGDLEEEAKDAHTLLLKAEQEDLQKKAQEAQAYHASLARHQQEYTAAISDTLNKALKSKEFDGIPVNPKVAQSTMDFIHNKRFVLPDGQRISEAEVFWYELQKPQNAELMVKFALLAQEGFKTDNIQKKAVSKQNNKLFQELTTKNKENKRQSPTEPQSLFFD